MDKGPESLQDAAMCVNLKPDWAKGFYRLGCALEKCKEWKDSAAVFAKARGARRCHTSLCAAAHGT
eukprot:2237740-Prymnesium_polylepis.1